jgi:3-oxoacyl-[acyl-carrier protein] reductase
MNLDLNGKRALVCGSTQGIGKAAAVELAALGANITLVARNEAKLKDTLSGLPFNGAQQHDYLVADFDFPDQLKNTIDKYLASHAVHILVNNTGGPPAGKVLDAKPEEFIKAITSHLIT